jgi:mono/diheme cytochrome c family protein
VKLICIVLGAVILLGAGFPLVVQAQETSRVSAKTLYGQFCQRCHESDGKGGGMKDIPDFTQRAWHDRKSNTQLVVSILEGKGTVMPAFRSKLDEARAKELVALIRAFAPSTAAKLTERDATQDFEKQLQQLQEELQELKRQFKALNTTSAPTPAPMALASGNGTQEERAAQQRSDPPALFRMHCQRCHGKDGSGVADKLDCSSPPDFSNSKWHEGRSDAELLMAILKGKRTSMPAFGKRFSEEEARGLVEYLRTLSPPRRTKRTDSREQSS